MAQINFETDPGLVWRPGLKRPKHNATADHDGEQWIAECPACGWRSEHGGNHAWAMITSMQHRSEHR